MPPTHRPRAVPPTERYADEYRRRGTRQSQGYTDAWLRAADRFKAEHPLCRMCERNGRVTPAQCVDHIIPHRGDGDLFWNESNWQSLCNPCHAGPKRRAEMAARRAEARALRPRKQAHPGRGG